MVAKWVTSNLPIISTGYFYLKPFFIHPLFLIDELLSSLIFYVKSVGKEDPLKAQSVIELSRKTSEKTLVCFKNFFKTFSPNFF